MTQSKLLYAILFRCPMKINYLFCFVQLVLHNKTRMFDVMFSSCEKVELDEHTVFVGLTEPSKLPDNIDPI